ncbi:efflux RND transporter periplasmic adaptor subunit [Undibacterium sp.]|jgi:RND family efflux transporter MFP subunit|uniref:efflux RND transporter periplasmic adaptor subunit n=1 Tax=Undibacterium sp. TaxID=1914977 RepID=UPI002CA49CC7|nr:efflux RND transporter periplasmic adaptor subunit [Undibacterium sp.]HTD03157.1 efflux RND transporter periplasmic adaptor subunit [Undibacterium sp.]
MSDQRHAVLGIHSVQESGEPHAHHHPHRGPILRRAKIIGACVLALLVLGAIATVALRVVQARALAASTAESAKIYVTTVNATAAGDSNSLTLPGTLQGIIESPIYARSSGYVLRWNKDIGSRVAKGEVLAEIDTPEVDQQLSQAVAARQQAASSLDLAKSSAERWEALRKKDAVTQQELNERTSAYTQAQANLAAADANVRRLQKLEGFKKVTAPFAGVITRRNVAIGDLIDAGNGGTGRALFTLTQVDPLRVYVYVPQAYSQRIKVGDTVQVTQGELAGQVFQGTVARTAGAIDVATRTLQIEINLPNRDNKLLAGAYVQVALPVSGTANVLVVPPNVILFRPEGARIAVVDDKGHVKLHAVNIGHDLGSALEILDGISSTDKLILNPADSLADNDIVTVVQPKQANAAGKTDS